VRDAEDATVGVASGGRNGAEQRSASDFGCSRASQQLAKTVQKRADAWLDSEVDLSDRSVFNDRTFGNTKATTENARIWSFYTASADQRREMSARSISSVISAG
jgi:hypothetical protein